MILYNTANPTQKANFQSAIFQGLADSGGLFMPEQLPVLPQSFFDRLPDLKFTEMAFEICHSLIGDEVNSQELKSICESAFDFEIPLVSIDNQVFCLELFHGPSLAFKDFGARFMSRIMAYFNQKMQKRLHVLVATSGDTGGAVAMGFHNVPGIRVTILFPKGRVSRYQEMQLTSLGGNVQALEVNGTFDDCQMLVKKAFSDRELSGEEGLTSANSINIARLIPQSLYYFWAWGQIQKLRPAARVVFSVPSGNFGNICAGAFAQKMGLPIEKLVASVNDNCVFADYLKTGKFEPALSKATLSNAMDVGNPSNFARIEALFGGFNGIRKAFESYTFSDEETSGAMLELWHKHRYLSEPHAAVGYLGLKRYFEENQSAAMGIFLGTAHPAKFLPVLPEEIKMKTLIPESLTALLENPSVMHPIEVNFDQLLEKVKGFRV